MEKKELEKMLLDMINSSEMIINRRDFRSFYFVSSIKKIRHMKFQKIFDTNQNYKIREFSECDYFMKIDLSTTNEVTIRMNIDIQNLLKNCFNNRTLTQEFIIDFFSKHYNLKNRIYYSDFVFPNMHLNEKSFDTSYRYNNVDEDKTCVFDFQKYKFDLCNYSYKKLVNIFKKI